MASFLSLSGPAGAAEPVEDPFQEQLGQAASHFRAHRFKEALSELQQAYALNPLPRLHYNMSQCHQQLGQFREELKHLELLLATDPDMHKEPARKQQVEDRIEELHKALGLDEVPPTPTPLYKRWWFWTLLGGAAAGAAAGITGGILAKDSLGGSSSLSNTAITWTALTQNSSALQLRW